MTATLDERVTVLERKVRRLEATTGCGQATLPTDMAEFRQEVSGRLDRLESGVATLKSDVGMLIAKLDKAQADMTEIKTDVVGFTNEVRTSLVLLTTRVDAAYIGITAIKGALAEILDRVPPKAA